MKIALLAADTTAAQEAHAVLDARYGAVDLDQADTIVALGGDGFLLETLHRAMPLHKPVFGMRLGTVGFLLNDYRVNGLDKRLAQAQKFVLHPLMMAAHRGDDVLHAFAFNEVSLLRETRQAARIKITVDNVERMSSLMSDGVLVSTAAGSTAYNMSAHGPILPLNANILALTPISPFRPRRWRGAMIPAHAIIRFDILECAKRPVSAVADFTEVRDVSRVDVRQSTDHSVTLLFDPEANLEERILREQFDPTVL